MLMEAPVFGSTLLPVVTSTPVSIGVLPSEASVGSVLGFDLLVLPDSTPSVDDAGEVWAEADESFIAQQQLPHPPRTLQKWPCWRACSPCFQSSG